MSEVQTANGLNIRVHEFFEQTDDVRDANGKVTGEVVVRDYVKYGPPHLMDRSAVIARVDRIMKAEKPTSENPAEHAAWDRRQYIETKYKAWKSGEELPENGTPLAALNFLRREDIDALKRAAIRTAEELANLSDSIIDSVKLPSMRNKRTQAQNFLAAQDTNKVAAREAARDATIAEQAEQLAEMRRQMAEMMKPKAESEPEVDENGDKLPKRGRKAA